MVAATAVGWVGRKAARMDQTEAVWMVSPTAVHLASLSVALRAANSAHNWVGHLGVCLVELLAHPKAALSDPQSAAQKVVLTALRRAARKAALLEILMAFPMAVMSESLMAGHWDATMVAQKAHLLVVVLVVKMVAHWAVRTEQTSAGLTAAQKARRWVGESVAASATCWATEWVGQTAAKTDKIPVERLACSRAAQMAQ